VLRGVITVVTFIVFVGIVVWAWSGRNRARFEEAARLPFEQDEQQGTRHERLHEQFLVGVCHRHHAGRHRCLPAAAVVQRQDQGHDAGRQHHRPRVGRGPARDEQPLPRWWVGLFIITCVFAFAYLYLYPGLGSYQGSLKWTQVGQLDQELAKGKEQVAPIYAAFAGKSVEELAKDHQAMAIGERLFMNNCAQCHGSDARGGKGFPNLTDKQWLGRHAGADRGNHRQGPHRHDAADGRRRGHARGRAQRGQLRAQPVGLAA
jgi:mono/diheme cytochrome c family protein/cbb3-type cytochrome oxidase subunit 3